MIEPYCKNSILEIGSGVGNYTELFINYKILIPSDYLPEYLEVLTNRFKINKAIDPILFDASQISSENIQQLKDKKIDTIVMQNVLEHIENEDECINHLLDILEDNGNLILVLPAHHFLFCKMDSLYGHYRRYNKCDINMLASKHNITVEYLHYFNIFSFWGWIINMKLLKRESLPQQQVILFDKYIVPISSRLERAIPNLFGLSLIAVIKK